MVHDGFKDKKSFKKETKTRSVKNWLFKERNEFNRS